MIGKETPQGYLSAAFLFLCFLFFGIVQGRPTEGLDKKDTDKGSDAVDPHILYRRAAVGNKRLVIFIQSGKTYADNACKDHKPEAPDLVYIEREGNGDGKQEIFRHVGGFSYIILDAMCFAAQFFITLAKIEYLILSFYNLIADFIA